MEEEYKEAASKLRGLKWHDEDLYDKLKDYAEPVFNELEKADSEIWEPVIYDKLKQDTGVNSSEFADIKEALRCLGYYKGEYMKPLEDKPAEAYINVLKPPAEEYEGMLESLSEDLEEQDEESGRPMGEDWESRAEFGDRGRSA